MNLGKIRSWWEDSKLDPFYETLGNARFSLAFDHFREIWNRFFDCFSNSIFVSEEKDVGCLVFIPGTDRVSVGVSKIHSNSNKFTQKKSVGLHFIKDHSRISTLKNRCYRNFSPLFQFEFYFRIWFLSFWIFSLIEKRVGWAPSVRKAIHQFCRCPEQNSSSKYHWEKMILGKLTNFTTVCHPRAICNGIFSINKKIWPYFCQKCF